MLRATTVTFTDLARYFGLAPGVFRSVIKRFGVRVYKKAYCAEHTKQHSGHRHKQIELVRTVSLDWCELAVAEYVESLKARERKRARRERYE
jgi:hypothetical protein